MFRLYVVYYMFSICFELMFSGPRWPFSEKVSGLNGIYECVFGIFECVFIEAGDNYRPKLWFGKKKFKKIHPRKNGVRKQIRNFDC